MPRAWLCSCETDDAANSRGSRSVSETLRVKVEAEQEREVRLLMARDSGSANNEIGNITKEQSSDSFPSSSDPGSSITEGSSAPSSSDSVPQRQQTRCEAKSQETEVLNPSTLVPPSGTLPGMIVAPFGYGMQANSMVQLPDGPMRWPMQWGNGAWGVPQVGIPPLANELDTETRGPFTAELSEIPEYVSQVARIDLPDITALGVVSPVRSTQLRPRRAVAQAEALTTNAISNQPSTDTALDDELLDEASLDLLVSALAKENAQRCPRVGSEHGTESDEDGNEYTDHQSATTNWDETKSEQSQSPFEYSDGYSSSTPRTARQGVTTTGAEAGRAPGMPPRPPKAKRVRRPCTIENCGKRSRSQGLCIAHGGGRRCIVEGCDKSSQGENLCIKHGGGKRCSVDGCFKAAQTNSLCKAHGGGPRCGFPNCEKSSQGGGFCRSHGGGRRCKYEGCMKGTQRGDFCALHGGLRLCMVEGCLRNDRGGGLCAHHGGGKRCSISSCNRACRRDGLCSSHLRLLANTSQNQDDPSHSSGNSSPRHTEHERQDNTASQKRRR